MGTTESLALRKTPTLPPVERDDLSPSPEELKTLRHVCDTIPYTIFLVVAAEAAERFAYRSLTGPMRESKQADAPKRRLISVQKITFRILFTAPVFLEHWERSGRPFFLPCGMEQWRNQVDLWLIDALNFPGPSDCHGDRILLSMLVLFDADFRSLRGGHVSRPLQNRLDGNNVSEQAENGMDVRDLTSGLSISTATVGMLILCVTSIPRCLEKGAGFPGLMVALFVVGLG